MTTVTTCSNPAEAELLHSLLMEHGIEAFVLGDPFGGAIHLQVPADQAEEARRLLQEAEQGLAPQDEDDAADR